MAMLEVPFSSVPFKPVYAPDTLRAIALVHLSGILEKHGEGAVVRPEGNVPTLLIEETDRGIQIRPDVPPDSSWYILARPGNVRRQIEVDGPGLYPDAKQNVVGFAQNVFEYVLRRNLVGGIGAAETRTGLVELPPRPGEE